MTIILTKEQGARNSATPATPLAVGTVTARAWLGWTSSLHTRHQETPVAKARSEEHTSELQSRGHLVCRLLLGKNNETAPPQLGQESAHGIMYTRHHNPH